MTRCKKVAVVHKANVIKLAYGLFRDICYEVAKQYPEVEDYHTGLAIGKEDFLVKAVNHLKGLTLMI